MKRLILGGVKSGKSRVAEQLAVQWAAEPGRREQDVIYLATAQAKDSELARRIARHRELRPQGWITVEEAIDIAPLIERASGQGKCVLLECLTLWMSNLLEDEVRLGARVEEFCTVFKAYEGEIILVSNETGMGIMPANALARRFGDEIGVLHQRLAAICDEVVLTVAGLPHYLKTVDK